MDPLAAADCDFALVLAKRHELALLPGMLRRLETRTADQGLIRWVLHRWHAALLSASLRRRGLRVPPAVAAAAGEARL